LTAAVRGSKAVIEHIRHNLVGYIALFLVLGGTAVALPGRNKVDSGDIKRNAVRASDIARNAVTPSKIAPRSVDSLRVIDDSLGGADIDESTLSLRLPPGAVGPTEAADRQQRIVVTPGALHAIDGAVPLEQVTFAVVSYHPDEEGSAFLSSEVPNDRVEGSPLTLRLIWSTAGSTGSMVWDIDRQAIGIGEVVDAAEVGAEAVASAGKDIAVATSFQIPGSEVRNGDLLGFRIGRDADDPRDNLAAPARLHLVEIDYTATG
jgi:hypothetical protein